MVRDKHYQKWVYDPDSKGMRKVQYQEVLMIPCANIEEGIKAMYARDLLKLIPLETAHMKMEQLFDIGDAVFNLADMKRGAANIINNLHEAVTKDTKFVDTANMFGEAKSGEFYIENDEVYFKDGDGVEHHISEFNVTGCVDPDLVDKAVNNALYEVRNFVSFGNAHEAKDNRNRVKRIIKNMGERIRKAKNG